MSKGITMYIVYVPYQVDTNHLDLKYCVFPVLLIDFPRLPLPVVDPVTMSAADPVDLSDTPLN